MRGLMLTALCILSCHVLTAQKNFEGTIIYTIRENAKPAGKMTVEFGPAAIRASFEENGGVDNKEIFVRFDSLFVAEVNHQLKTYRPTYYPNVPTTLAPSSIGGYKTRQVPMAKKTSMAGYFPGAVFFLAEDLSFTVPPSMIGIDELMMLNDGKVVLGFILPDKNKLPVTNFDSSYNDPEFHGVIAKATSITPRNQDPLLFAIPADYVRHVPEADHYDEYLTDTTIAVIDSSAAIYDAIAVDTASAIEPVHVDSPQPKNKKAPAKKTGKKPAAGKTATPAPARKPD